MPYPSRYGGNRRGSSRGSYGKKNYMSRRRGGGGGYLDTAARALAVAYAVKKLINVEFKTITTSFTSDPNTTGSVVNLTAIAQGDTIANRQGNKIRSKYLKVSGNVRINASATSTHLRLVIVRDNNGNTTQPAIADLFPDVGSFFGNKNKSGDPQSNSRFTVLWDKFIMLDVVGLEQVPIGWSTELDHHIYFTGTGATDEGKGHLYLFIASNEATNDPAVQVDSMFKFIDN